MQNGTQRYHALTELTGHMMRASGVMDDWFETIWSEVETLKQGTDDWKSNEFRTKWKEVSSKAKAVREKRNQVREAIEWLVEKHNWCTREFNDEVLTPFLSGGLTSQPSRTMYEALKKASKQNISPIETLQRASERMLRRLEGREK